jgi:hypothetical protein
MLVRQKEIYGFFNEKQILTFWIFILGIVLCITYLESESQTNKTPEDSSGSRFSIMAIASAPWTASN